MIEESMTHDGALDGAREKTELRLWDLFELIQKEGRPIGPTSFAKEGGIHRTYLYTFHELAAAIAEYGRKTQPKISGRGAGVTKSDAKKKDLSARVRREHTQWSREVPELKEKIKETEDSLKSKDKKITSLEERQEKLMRTCEYLLVLAFEGGASPRELEKIREIIGEPPSTKQPSTDMNGTLLLGKSEPEINVAAHHA